MRRVNLHEAKTHLSRLVAQAVAGEGFVICKAGVPLVQVTRLADAETLATPPRRLLGLLAGQCSVPEDFDRFACEEIADLFEGLAGFSIGVHRAVKLLLDTHLLVWAMGEPSRLGPVLRDGWRIRSTPSASAWLPSGSS